MWERFEVIYGDKWLRKFDKDPLVEENDQVLHIQLIEQEWYDAIKYFGIRTIGLAINYSRDSLIWPPSIAEFVKLCNEAQERLRFEPVDANQGMLTVKKKTTEEKEHSKKLAEKFMRDINDKLHKKRKGQEVYT